MLHVFIINSFSNRVYSSEYIRDELERKKNFKYLIFNTEYAGHEALLTQQIYDLFPGERIRFYICGGSGTFKNVFSGLKESNRAEFAEIPFGSTNDFLEIFGDERDKFSNLDSMINGGYTRCDYLTSNMGDAHNAISMGYDTLPLRMINRMDNTYVLGASVANSIAGIIALFGKYSFKGTIKAGGNTYSGKFAEVAIVKGKLLGSLLYIGRDVKICDGQFTVAILKKRNFFFQLGAIISLLKPNRPKASKYWTFVKTSEIEIIPNKQIYIDFDGELLKGDYLKIQIGTEKIKYVLPCDLGGDY